MPRDVASEVHVRRYAVHVAAEGRHRACTVQAGGFEAAAVAFLEGATPSIDAQGVLTVIVHDCESGRERCFRLDLETGAAGACH